MKRSQLISQKEIDYAYNKLYTEKETLETALQRRQDFVLPSYQTAKLACDIFEFEYVGRDQESIWKWACRAAIHKSTV